VLRQFVTMGGGALGYFWNLLEARRSRRWLSAATARLLAKSECRRVGPEGIFERDWRVAAGSSRCECSRGL